ncbi:MAG: fumarylacetoacetate hydrolase family protein [Firmicutes bacterium]|nr:fumarylacetoacetate hydrolase family protein [Bacillota bacterium]
MYLATFNYNDSQKIGVLTKEKSFIIPMDEIFKKLKRNTPKNMTDFIENFDDNLLKEISSIIENKDLLKISINDVDIKAPIPYPKKNIICLGKNYLDHVEEIKGLTTKETSIPKLPIYFSKIANPCIGQYDLIRNHSNITNHIDYEVELAIIIGKKGSNIKRSEVKDYIFGFSIANDITARNLQKEHIQWLRGKSLDTFCPMGPYLVHKSVIPFPVELNIECKVNGEIRQSSNTKNMIFNIPYIVSDISKGITLEPGDIILTGTPSGVGLGFKPPKYLKSGDTVECNIEKIGTLVNKVK